MFFALLPYLLQLAGLGVLLGLFYGINQRVQRLRIRVARCEGLSQGEVQQLIQGIENLKQKVKELEHVEPPPPQAPNTPGVLDVAIRTKVLKMHRLGHPVGRIADMLRIPKGEVDLLLKVHGIVMQPYRFTGAAADQAGS